MNPESFFDMKQHQLFTQIEMCQAYYLRENTLDDTYSKNTEMMLDLLVSRIQISTNAINQVST